MKSKRILAELLIVCALLSSCASIGESVTNAGNILNTESKTDDKNQESNNDFYDLSVKKYSFKDDDVLIEIELAGDRMILEFANNSKDRIILHIESARVTTKQSDYSSQIVTFEQSKLLTNHFTIQAIVVNPGAFFTEEYVALDSMSYNALDSHGYVITEWATDENFQLSISYGLVTFKGEIVKNLIIN